MDGLLDRDTFQVLRGFKILRENHAQTYDFEPLWMICWTMVLLKLRQPSSDNPSSSLELTLTRSTPPLNLVVPALQNQDAAAVAVEWSQRGTLRRAKHA